MRFVGALFAIAVSVSVFRLSQNLELAESVTIGLVIGSAVLVAILFVWFKHVLQSRLNGGNEDAPRRRSNLRDQEGNEILESQMTPEQKQLKTMLAPIFDQLLSGREKRK